MESNYQKLTVADLLSLEEYHRQRKAMRQAIQEYKKHRRLAIGPQVTLYFENRKTMQYQIQEMLYIEKIFMPEGIEDELDTYNPLIPDGDNLKATMMIEYVDVEERKAALKELVGIEDKVWLQVGDSEKIFALADEDLDRRTEGKTSAVHFLRFQLDKKLIEKLKQGSKLLFGVAHSEYQYLSGHLSQSLEQSLIGDLM